MSHVNEQEHMIKDWAGNLMFNGRTFPTFEDADDFLSQHFEKTGQDYEVEREEYVIFSVE